jgi:hypothetical protein
MNPRPLNDVRVLDFSTTIAGPHCSRLMADLGADVIKVEAPEGELMRSRPVQRNGAGTMFGQLNAGKRWAWIITSWRRSIPGSSTGPSRGTARPAPVRDGLPMRR